MRKFTRTWLFAMLCMPVVSSAAVYVTGNDGIVAEWDPENPTEIAPGTDGIYTWNVSAGCKYKFSTDKGDWTTFNESWLRPGGISGSTTFTMQPYVQYSYTQNDSGTDDANITVESDGRIRISLTEKWIRFIPAPAGISLATTANGWATGNYGSVTLTDDGAVYTWKRVRLETGTGFQLIIDGTQRSSEEGLSLTADTPYKIGTYVGHKDSNMTAATPGRYDITVTSKSGTYTISLTNAQELTMSPSQRVNMPLKPADFAGNKKHYFIVGSRMGDWRLQAEWELLPGDDGRLTLADRLMYRGPLAIGMVDSYEDYINHRCTIFYQQTSINSGNTTIKLTANKASEGPVRYDGSSPADLHPNGNYIFFNWYNTESNDNGWYHEDPAYVGLFTVTLDGSGNPQELSVGDVLSQRADIYRHLCFQFVGDNIYNENADIVNPAWAPHNKYSSGIAPGWSNAYIQYDNDGNPYVDAYGEYMYQTVYQYDWITSHPSYFYRGQDDFDYTTRNVTFFHYEDLKDDPFYNYYLSKTAEKNGNAQVTIGQSDIIIEDEDNGEWKYRAQIVNYGSSSDQRARTSTNWVPYVVSDVWLSGEFKIWSGFGGNSVEHIINSAGSNNANQRAHWYAANAGHAAKNTPELIEGFDINRQYDATSTEVPEITVYGTAKNIDGANFKVNTSSSGELRYFKRIIFWYDAAGGGIDNSVLQLIVEDFAPEIHAHRSTADNHHLTYDWSILVQSGMESEAADKILNTFTIERFRAEGNSYVSDGFVTIDDPAFRGNSVTRTVELLKDKLFDDPTYLASGRYRYEISVQFTDGTSKKAVSNPVMLYDPQSPVNFSVNQIMDGDRYTFGIRASIGLKDNVRAMTFNGNYVQDLVDGYWLQIRKEETAGRLNLNNPDAATYAESKTVADGSVVRTIDDCHWVWVPFTPGEQSVIEWYALDPADATADDNRYIYDFTAYVQPAEDVDLGQWANELRFTATDDSTPVIIPAPAADLGTPRFEIDTANAVEITPEVQPIGYETSGAVHYPAVNYVAADITLAEAKVVTPADQGYHVEYSATINGSAEETRLTPGTGRIAYLPWDENNRGSYSLTGVKARYVNDEGNILYTAESPSEATADAPAADFAGPLMNQATTDGNRHLIIPDWSDQTHYDAVVGIGFGIETDKAVYSGFTADADNDSDNTIRLISADGHSSLPKLEDFHPRGDSEDYDDNIHNWSSIAINAGMMPIRVNDALVLGGEADGTRQTTVRYTIYAHYPVAISTAGGEYTPGAAILAAPDDNSTATETPAREIIRIDRSVSDETNLDLDNNKNVSTGISETATAGALSVYPNPASAATTLSGTRPLGRINIISTGGLTVKSLDAGESQAATVDVSGLPAGLYVIVTADGTTAKLVKK